MIKVFVYGTLKRGHGNWHRYLRDSRFIGPARTDGLFSMVSFGVPMIFEHGDHPVAGEVFEVDDSTLQRLDSLESAYERISIPVTISPEDGSASFTDMALVYVGRDRNPARYGDLLVNPTSGGFLVWGLDRMATMAQGELDWKADGERAIEFTNLAVGTAVRCMAPESVPDFEEFCLKATQEEILHEAMRLTFTAARCPDCGADVPTIFEHVDGCPEELED